MSQTRLALSRSIQNKLTSRELIPHPDEISKPTHDNQIEIRTTPIQQHLNLQYNNQWLQGRIRQLQQQLEDYQFEHEANSVYNKQFRMLGKLLGNQEMQFQDIRVNIENMILNSNKSNYEQQQYSQNKYQKEKPLEIISSQVQQIISTINKMCQQQFIGLLIKSPQKQFWNTLNAISQNPHAIAQYPQIQSHKTAFHQIWSQMIHQKFNDSQAASIVKQGEIKQEQLLCLKKQIEVLRAQQERWTRLQKQNERLNEEYGRLEQQTKAQINIYKQQLTKRQQQLHQTQQTLQEYEHQITNIRTQLSQKTQLFVTITAELSETKLKSTSSTNYLETQIEQLAETLNREREQVYHLQNQNTNLCKQLGICHDRVNQKQIEIKGLVQVVEEERRYSQKLSGQLVERDRHQGPYTRGSQNKTGQLMITIQNLENKLDRLQQQLAQKDHIIHDKNEQLTVIREMQERLQQQNDYLSRQHERLQQNQSQMAMEYSNKLSDDLEYSNKSSSIEQFAKSLEDKLKIKEEEIQSTINIVNELEQRNDVNRLKIRELQQEIGYLRGIIEKLEKERNRRQEEKQINQANQIKYREELENQHSQQKQLQHYSLQQHHQSSQSKNLTYLSQNRQKFQQIPPQTTPNYQKSQQQSHHIQQFSLQIPNDKAPHLQSTISHLQSILAKNQQQLTDTNQYYQHELAQYQQQINKLTEIRQIMEGDHQEQINRVLGDISHQQEDNKLLKMDNERLRDSLQKLTESIEALLEQNKRMQQQVNKTSNNNRLIDEIQNTLDDKDQSIMALQNGIQQIKRKYQRILSNYEGNTQQLKIAKKDLHQLQNTRNQLQQSNMDLTEENTKLKAQHQHYLSTFKSLNLRVQQLSNQNLSMSSQLLIYSQMESQMASHRKINSSNLSIMKNTIDLEPIYETSSQLALQGFNGIKNNERSLLQNHQQTKQSDAFNTKLQPQQLYKYKQKLHEVCQLSQELQISGSQYESYDSYKRYRIFNTQIERKPNNRDISNKQLSIIKESEPNNQYREIQSPAKSKVVSNQSLQFISEMRINQTQESIDPNSKLVSLSNDTHSNQTVSFPNKTNSNQTVSFSNNTYSNKNEGSLASKKNDSYDLYLPNSSKAVSINLIQTNKAINQSSIFQSGKFIIKEGVSYNTITNKSISSNSRSLHHTQKQTPVSIKEQSQQSNIISPLQSQNFIYDNNLLHTFRMPSPARKNQSKNCSPIRNLIQSSQTGSNKASQTPNKIIYLRRDQETVNQSYNRSISPPSIHRVTSSPPPILIEAKNSNHKQNQLRHPSPQNTRISTITRKAQKNVQMQIRNQSPPQKSFHWARKVNDYYPLSPSTDNYRYNNRPITRSNKITTVPTRNDSVKKFDEYYGSLKHQAQYTQQRYQQNRQRQSKKQQLFEQSKHKRIDQLSESNQSGLELEQKNIFKDCCPEC